MELSTTECMEQDVAAATPKVLLIDLENCPAQLQQLPGDLATYQRVVICYAQSGAKVPLNWLNPLASAITEQRLSIVQMKSVGKNAADFGICFTAGALMQELPENAHFVIVSNDGDLDHTVHLLRHHGRTAERVGAIAKEDKNAQPESDAEPHPEPTSLKAAVVLYCEHLLQHSKTRPAKTDTLLNSIKVKFKDSTFNPETIYKQLIANGAVQVNDKKVSYQEKQLSALVKASQH